MGGGVLRLERIANASVGPFTVGEVLPTAVIIAITMWDTVLGHAEVISGPPWAVALLLCAGAAALLWRRRRPLLVLTVIAVLGLLQVLVLGPTQSIGGPLSLAVAVFACGAHGTRPWAYLGMPVGVVVVLIATWAEDPAAFADSWSWSLNVLWVFGLGALVRWQMVLAARARDASAARAAATSAEERLALARDLHDVLAHSLAVMIVQAEAADELVETDPAGARGALARVEATGRSALADIRGLVGALRSDRDPTSSLSARAPGLEGLAALVDSVRASGLPVEMHLEGDVDRIPAETGQVVYRIVQEGLTNTLRHAGPTDAVVAIDVDPEIGVRVRIRDNGASPRVHVGGAPGRESVSADGHGLTGMRERVVEAGGTLNAGPDVDGGFVVAATLPIARTRA